MLEQDHQIPFLNRVPGVQITPGAPLICKKQNGSFRPCQSRARISLPHIRGRWSILSQRFPDRFFIIHDPDFLFKLLLSFSPLVGGILDGQRISDIFFVRGFMLDRRNHPRIPIVSIARLTYQGIEAEKSVLVRDISTHGLGVYTDEAYQQGDLVVVRLSLTGDLSETIAESIAGEVVWVTPLPDGAHYAIGIRFENMEVERPKLYAYVKRLEQMNPGAGPEIPHQPE
jgi:Tfp pilus assembly protein PilZ